ncbi:response regulator [Magnetococcales bacterium HHB-1]
MAENSFIKGLLIKVLLIDDQPITSTILKRFLKKYPEFRLYYCQDGNKALYEAERIRPSVILLDLIMPEVNGLDLLRSFRQRKTSQSLPIVMLSTEENPRVKAQCFAMGANDYLVKLPDKVEMIARLRHHAGLFFQFNREKEQLGQEATSILSTIERGYFTVDYHSKEIIDVDQTLAGWLNYDREDLIGQSPMFCITEDDRQIFSIPLLRIPEPERRTYQIGMLTKDKNSFEVQFRVELHHDHKIALFEFVRREDWENALSIFQEQERHLRLITRAAPVLIWYANHQQQRTFFNKLWLNYTGCNLSHTEQHWKEAIHPEDLKNYIKTFDDAFNQQETYSVEFRLRSFTGEYRWFFETGVPSLTSQNQFRGYIGSCVDITERKQIESQVRLLNERLEERVEERTLKLQHSEKRERRLRREQSTIRQLLQIALQPISLQEKLNRSLDIILDLPWLTIESRGCIFLTDPKKAQTLKMVAQKNLSSLVKQTCRSLAFGRCLCGKVANTRETLFVNHVNEEHTIRDNETPPHGHYILPIQANNEFFGVLNIYIKEFHKRNLEDDQFLHTVAQTVATMIDRNKQETLEKEKLSAESANKAKSQFLATMSHEIRTPMNAILGMSELLQETKLSSEQQRYVTVFHQAGETLLQLINDILDLSKIEAEQFQLDFVPFSLRQEVEAVLSILELKAQEKEIRFILNIPDSLCDRRLGDAARLKQILINLLSNAVKFTPQGTVTLTLLAPETDFIRVDIQDTGIGIDQEKLNLIFEPFIQEDTTITRKYGGTGLGLTICKHLVQSMGGWIKASSDHKKGGSTFSFLARIPEDPFPAKKTSQDHDAITTTEQTTQQASPQKILLVDDFEDNRILVQAFLKKSDYLVESAENGALAVEKVCHLKQPFDIILMDMQMPVMDGITATKTIREWEKKHQRKPILIIALTAYAMLEEKNRVLAAGCNAFLTKPVKKTSLIRTIETEWHKFTTEA